ncbi:MAG: DUF4091 domain-containing protein [Victivallaceae bacterium]|nr:DUF4091 domain-containing protein [Victivallaceae bacterium]
MTEKNVALAAADMDAHLVNTVYGHRAAACWPQAEDFDQPGNLVKPLRTKSFDQWIALHGKKKNYFFYLEQNLYSFAGEAVGTKRFERMVSQWITKLVNYANRKGIATAQIGIHLIDEPHSRKQFQTNTVWGNIIKSAVPEVNLFTPGNNGTFKNREAALKNMLEVYDIVCPLLPELGNKIEEIKKYIVRDSKTEKKLWLYSCLGPSRILDPYYYHRLQAWYCWKLSASGMAYWTYWNYYYSNSQASAWNELLAENTSYGMVYTTDRSLVSSKHWEAVLEGVEDYEYLAILQNTVKKLKAKGERSAVINNAEKLLQSLPGQVAGTYERADIYWAVDKNRTRADRGRIEILKKLEQLIDINKNEKSEL